MDIETWTQLLGWCSVINIGLLGWWLLWIVTARDWVFNLHHQWFPITRQQFDIIHYSGMGIYKIIVLIFFVIPYLVLRFLIEN